MILEIKMKIRINTANHERGMLEPEPYFIEFKDWNEALPELFKLHGRLIVQNNKGVGLDQEDMDADYYVTLYNNYVE